MYSPHLPIQNQTRNETYTTAKIHSQETLRHGGHKEATMSEMGYTIRQQTKAKHLTYVPLISITKKQAHNRTRPTMPTFIAAVASTSRELGIETVKLQEFLTQAYARKLTTTPNSNFLHLMM